MVKKIKIINSHQVEFSYPASFKIVWLTSAPIYSLVPNLQAPTDTYDKQ